MPEIIFLDGELLPAEQARISVLDHGFLYGDGLFETMRAANGVVFRLRDHLERLQRGSQLLRLPLPQPLSQLERAIAVTLEANGLRDAYVRLTISRGPGAMSPDPVSCPRPTVVVFARALAGPASARSGEGRRAILARMRSNAPSLLSRVKTLNYLPSICARMEARLAGFDDALLLNGEGMLTEATSSNLFLVDDGQIVTPDERDGLLPGITRTVVMELARRLGLPLQVRHVPPSELLCAEEAFLTSSISGIVPLVGFGTRAIGSGEPGNVTQMLASAYADLLTEETS